MSSSSTALYVLVVAGAHGDVYAEDHHFVFRNITQILAEPLDLVVAESERIILVARENDIVHGDDVHVAAVERIVYGAEDVFEIPLCGDVVCHGIVVLADGDHLVVVVAHQLEERQPDLVHLHGLFHQREYVVRVVRILGVPAYVAQRDAVTRQRRGCDLRGDVGYRFVVETCDVGRVLALGVGHAEEVELVLGTSGQRGQREVVALAPFGQFLPEAGQPFGHGDFVCRGDRKVHLIGEFPGRKLVDAVLVGGCAGISVAYDDSLQSVPLVVGHHSVDVGQRIYGGLYRAVVVIRAPGKGSGR